MYFHRHYRVSFSLDETCHARLDRITHYGEGEDTNYVLSYDTVETGYKNMVGSRGTCYHNRYVVITVYRL